MPSVSNDERLPFEAAGLDRSRIEEAVHRAWSEEMSVRPFGDGYLVDCPEGTHFVTLPESDCSCGTEAVCEHLRRVAIEINRGRIPAPSERTVPCRGCDRDVPTSAAGDPPYLCADCDLEPGDLVVDGEGDPNTPLLVISSPGRPAEMVTLPEDGRTVAEYPGNTAHPPDAPVVEAVYPQSVSTDRDPRVYLFPVTRLEDPE